MTSRLKYPVMPRVPYLFPTYLPSLYLPVPYLPTLPSYLFRLVEFQIVSLRPCFYIIVKLFDACLYVSGRNSQVGTYRPQIPPIPFHCGVLVAQHNAVSALVNGFI